MYLFGAQTRIPDHESVIAPPHRWHVVTPSIGHRGLSQIRGGGETGILVVFPRGFTYEQAVKTSPPWGESIGLGYKVKSDLSNKADLTV